MEFSIVHEVPGRLRVRLAAPVPLADLDLLTSVASNAPHANKATVYPRIGSVVICYDAAPGAREDVVSYLAGIDAAAIDRARTECSVAIAPRTNSLFIQIAELVGFHFARRWFLPAPLSALWALWRYRRFLGAALRSFGRARLDVPVLDAAAIGMSFLKRDPKTASETMFLLDLGETLEDYTRARSENELIYSLLAMPESAQLVDGDEERTVPSTDLMEGDLVVVRTGMPVCVDGVVERGPCDGEPIVPYQQAADQTQVGDDVFAGTAVESGEMYVRVRKTAADTRLRSIMTLVERSEALKAGAQTRRERLPDAIVPWNFLFAGIVVPS